MAHESLFLLGHPVSHSKSPAMYNALYEKLGLDWRYNLMDCAAPEQAQAFLARRDFLALNVTTPYKPLAFKAATVCAASARLAQGANVLVRKGDALIAYNVDGQGCVSYLEREGVSFMEASVAVCGTGPTALAIVHAAAQAGARDVLLLGRDKNRACAVLKAYAEDFAELAKTAIGMPAAQAHHLGFLEAYEHVNLRFGSYGTSKNAIAEADVIIDATPLGMKPGDPAPFDTALLHSGQTVLDAVYGHGITALVGAAREAGCTVRDGAGMLVAQAVVSAGIVCDIAEVGFDLAFEEAFSLMAAAAGFDLQEG